MAGPLVARREPGGIARHREGEDGAGGEHARRLAHGERVVGDVLEHLAEHERVEGRVREGKHRRVGRDDLAAHALPQRRERRLAELRAGHLEAARREPVRERALAGADVQHAPSGACAEQHAEEQPFAQLVARADEVGVAAPDVPFGHSADSTISSQRRPSTASLASRS